MNDMIEIERTPLVELQIISQAIFKSNLMGYESPEQIMTLLMLAESEGLHPVQAMRRYHIIDNKPSMRADAMLAIFIERGGHVEWHTHNDKIADATFKSGRDVKARINFTIENAKRAGLPLTNPKSNWMKRPDAMLRARLISKAIRMVDPSCVMGIYTPDEVEEIGSRNMPIKPIRKVTPQPKQEERIDVTPPEEVINTEAKSKELKDFGVKEIEVDKAEVLKKIENFWKTAPENCFQHNKNTIENMKSMRNVSRVDDLDVDDLIALLGELRSE